MKIRLNYDLLSYKKGAIIEIDKLSIKQKNYFVRRLRDSNIDNCVEEIKKSDKITKNLARKAKNKGGNNDKNIST